MATTSFSHCCDSGCKYPDVPLRERQRVAGRKNAAKEVWGKRGGGKAK